MCGGPRVRSPLPRGGRAVGSRGTSVPPQTTEAEDDAGARRPYPAGSGVPSQPRDPRGGPGAEGQGTEALPGNQFSSVVVSIGAHEHLVVKCLG